VGESRYAKCETVGTLPTFRDAYRRRRCILPVDGFKMKRPFAIAMRNGYPFGLGGLWENWKDPTSGEWVRTFAIITTDANELGAEIHNRTRYWYRRGVKTAIASTAPALAERCGALRHAMGPSIRTSAHSLAPLLRSSLRRVQPCADVRIGR